MRSRPESTELDTLCSREALMYTDLVSLRLQLCLRADSRHMSSLGAVLKITESRSRTVNDAAEEVSQERLNQNTLYRLAYWMDASITTGM